MTSKIKRAAGVLALAVAVFLSLYNSGLALDESKSSALSSYIMAVLLDDLGDVDSAIKEYKKALKIDRESPAIHLNLASSYIKNNDLPKAIEELKKTAEFDPQAVEPHAILALLYSSQGQLDLAAVEYEIALKKASVLQPKNVEIYQSLGMIYLQQKKFKEAEDTYRLINKLAPADAEAHYYLANIHNELKNNQAAEQELKTALELNPDYHQALNFLGYLYVEESRDLDKAEAMIKKALEIEPENGAYIDSLGWLYYRQGKFEEAKGQLEKASHLILDPVVYDHLGDLLLKLEDTENALVNWKKSLELNPDQEKVKEKIKQNETR